MVAIGRPQSGYLPQHLANCWEGMLPRDARFNGSNSCTRYYLGRRSEEVAKMEAAFVLHSWWEATRSEWAARAAGHVRREPQPCRGITGAARVTRAAV